MTEIVDSTAVEDQPEGAEQPATTALEVRQPAPVDLNPQDDADYLVARLTAIKDAMDRAMTPGVDYGVIPGTNSKPSLLKPGAEKLSNLFKLDIQIATVQHWSGDHLTVEAKAVAYHAPTGMRLGDGEGMCSTREKKYAVRKQERICPECNAAAILKSKKRDDGSGGNGWFCWRKRDGCGASFPDDNDPRIANQVVGEIDNPDLPDSWNTVIKMARKRARIDAVLNTTGASALFTQDAEDVAGAPAAAADVAPAGPPFGPDADTGLSAAASTAILGFCNGDRDAAIERWRAVKVACGGTLPQVVAAALCAAAGVPQPPDGPPPA